jgi:hypothetical protein
MSGSAVCLAMKPVGEPDAGNRHVRSSGSDRSSVIRQRPFFIATVLLSSGSDRSSSQADWHGP